MKEFDYYIYIDYSENLIGYAIIEKDKLKINIDYTKKFGLTKHPLLGKLQKGKSITYQGKKIDVKKATIKKPGKKISIILDTSPDKSIEKFVLNSDLLICDSTWSSDTINRRGSHMTNLDAANIAKKSKSKKLILTHFSQRYKTVNELLKESKKVFKKNDKSKEAFRRGDNIHGNRLPDEIRILFAWKNADGLYIGAES